ncbi:ABC transporter permease [Ferrimonas pelagia]|uniref:ABC transporter permease n=1 Tax=Ferrimonas pelagia TaxID=1177826 RepID=A0ABP9FHE6_9GAMM
MSDWRALWHEQARALLSDRPVLLTFFAGLILYVFLYPLPYLHQVAGAQPVLLLDQDNSATSRQLVRALQASPGIRFSATEQSIAEAQRQVRAGDSKGLVLIPPQFEQQIRRGVPATVVVSADAHYFLSYGTIAEQVVQASSALSGEIRLQRQLQHGHTAAAYGDRYPGLQINMVPASNLKMGYLDYVLPGLFVLILHQVMIICVGIATVRQHRQSGRWQRCRSWQILAVQASLLLPPFLLAACWYLGPALAMYQVTLLAALPALWRLLLPFFLASFFLAVSLGLLFRHRDSLSQMMVLVSMPLLFTAGFVWPVESLPAPWLALWGLIPSQPMMQAMIQLNQMAAPLSALADLQRILWLLTLGWGAIALALWQRKLASARV